jgi:hypothetical protein
MANITFTKTIPISEEFNPVPASQQLPDWYKETTSYISGSKKPSGNGSTTATIKRCMPVFDSLSAGYYLSTYTDIWVSQIEQDPEKPGVKTPWYEWPSFTPLSFHPMEQAPLHPKTNGTPIPKIINPWSIKTPPGYSTLFLPPVHRENPFVALVGIVDTDTYTAPVNIVFVLSDPKFEGLIPAGTPLVQVIPFKRDSWSMSLGAKSEYDEQEKIATKLRNRFFDSYKIQFRQKKEYK